MMDRYFFQWVFGLWPSLYPWFWTCARLLAFTLLMLFCTLFSLVLVLFSLPLSTYLFLALSLPYFVLSYSCPFVPSVSLTRWNISSTSGPPLIFICWTLASSSARSLWLLLSGSCLYFFCLVSANFWKISIFMTSFCERFFLSHSTFLTSTNVCDILFNSSFFLIFLGILEVFKHESKFTIGCFGACW